MPSDYLPPGVVRDQPGPGQVSVWDFPRPPIVVPDTREVTINFAGTQICQTTGALLVLETSHPPTWYLPSKDFLPGALKAAVGSSVCEFKGQAAYYSITANARVALKAAWGYSNPWPGFESLRDHVALYAAAMDSVTVNGIPVEPQPGGFYGGWITPDVVGPFKGTPNTHGW